MRGSDERSGSLFSYVDLEARVRQHYPLLTIRKLRKLRWRIYRRRFRSFKRTLAGPRLQRRGCSGRCCCRPLTERQLMEPLEFDLLFRRFVGLGVDDPVWDHSAFSKNRDQLLEVI